MIESFFQWLQYVPPLAAYISLLVIPFIENVFPPSPSDILIVVAGVLISSGVINFPLALLITALGSELGFILLFYLGRQTDKKLLKAGRLKFINRETLEVAERWFIKYGFTIILFNRFISGIRSVIAYFAGVSGLPVNKTIVLSSISAVLWHGSLLGLGWIFGTHADIHAIDRHLDIYSYAILSVVALAAVIVGVRYFRGKKNNASPQ
jgi:membrane protein DedA with SNARE-associated domain